MSEEQLKAFLEKVKVTNLQEKLKAAASSDAVLRLRKRLGLVFLLKN